MSTSNMLIIMVTGRANSLLMMYDQKSILSVRELADRSSVLMGNILCWLNVVKTGGIHLFSQYLIAIISFVQV